MGGAAPQDRWADPPKLVTVVVAELGSDPGPPSSARPTKAFCVFSKVAFNLNLLGLILASVFIRAMKR